MRALMAGLAMLAAVAASPAQAAEGPRGRATQIDLSTPQGAVDGLRRIWCTEKDGEPVYWFWRGDVYSRRAGEPDKLLFKVEGLNTRTCVRRTDPERGEGFRSVSRELLIYLDPKTGQPLGKWTNPWTGQAVDVMHVANDPVNADFYVKTRTGEPLKWEGSSIAGQFFWTVTVPLFYPNPLGGAYQPEVGGTYHATEMFNFMGDDAVLLDRRTVPTDIKVGWVRLSQWLPWMRMGDRDGMLYFHTAGRKTIRWEDVSELMRREVEQRYPAYRNPPPLDDARPNMTSWKYYDLVRKGEIKAPAGN